MDSFPRLSENALLILEKRYLRKSEEGEILETPDQMFRRVAENIAKVDDRYGDRPSSKEREEFFQAMRSLAFLPNSPTLMNAGTSLQMLSACFVLPVEDSIEAIYDAVKWAAIVHQGGGGSGMSFSHLRPAGDVVRSTGGVASGPVSFMKVFDAATEAVKQGGRRRGANMGVLSVDHPDIEGFIAAKDDPLALSNFNLSVAVNDEFMERAKKREMYDLVNPRTGMIVRRLNAAFVLERIATAAWRTGDPGVIFIDAVNRANPTPALGHIEATNPCGEVPLLPFEACNLGSINLLASVNTSKEIDWDRLGVLVDLGIRFLDNVIDANRYPLHQTEEIVQGNRKIGLGIMGFADLLILLNISYGSPESLSLAGQLIRFIRRAADASSTRIAESRGSFPNLDGTVFQGPRRNATVLSIAPTGTISIIANCSSGIEPLYAVSYSRRALDGNLLKVVDEHFLSLAIEGRFYSEELMRSIADRASVQEIKSIPSDVRRVFVTAHDIPSSEQIAMQAVFQQHVDNAVSKTINLPADTHWQTIYQALFEAYERGCKGITFYREGSKPEQVLTTIKDISTCPRCGRILKTEEGAVQCENCG